MTGKKVFFSIKNKIVLALIIILIAVTAFNLTYSYLMFKSDKEAYIFENSLRSSELASEKIRDFIEAQSKELAKSVKVTNSNFYLTGELLTAKIKSLNKFIIHYNDVSFKDSEKLLKGIVQTNVNTKIKTEKIKIIPFKENILILMKQSTGYRFALISSETIIETLSKDNIFNYIVTGKGRNIFHGNKKLVRGFRESTISNSNQGSILANGYDQEYLISYTRLKQLDLYIYSYISQKDAFAIFKNIILKNISFTVIILGIFLILSLVFSNKLTKPILQLIDKTRDIADGNMEGTIEVSTNDELQILGSSVNIMSSKIMKLLDDKQAMIKELEVANDKLDEYNKNLEKTVQERTKELREANGFITAMINSLDQGLFVFNKTKKCLEIFTKACESMFNKVPSGVDVTKLLKLDKAGEEGFEKWSNVIFSNMMPFSAAKSLGPKEVITSSYGEEDFKFISLNYYPMNNDDDQLENVLVVATDKTIQIETEQKFKEKDAHVSMILNIIRNKKAFYDFLDEMNDMLINLSDLDKHKDIENTAMIAFHSMNGGFANYSMAEVVKVARECESQIKSFKGNEQELKRLVIYLIKDFRTRRDEVLVEIEKQLGDSKEVFEISKKELLEFKTRINDQENPQFLYAEYFERSQIGSIFKQYSGLVTKISEDIKKPMTPLLITGGDIRIDTDKIKEFSSSLVHLFRNCMDHGIENADTRLAAEKPAEGSISINCKLIPTKSNNNELIITVQDDGGGINVSKVREILSKKEIEHESLSDKEAMMYIFKPDFTTAEQLTELSGRGVGMSAIDQAIQNLGGSLDLESQSGVGSKFIFKLPLA